MVKIIACAMVYNEAENKKIIKSLDSLYPHVDAICIMDTHSTDNTIELCKSWHEKHPSVKFAIYEDDFVNYSVGRNKVLTFARKCCIDWKFKTHKTYTLMFDANEELIINDNQWKEKLKNECYSITINHYDPRMKLNSVIIYTRLIRCDSDIRYGKTRAHDYPETDDKQVEFMDITLYQNRKDDDASTYGRLNKVINFLLEDLMDPELSDPKSYTRTCGFLGKSIKNIAIIESIKQNEKLKYSQIIKLSHEWFQFCCDKYPYFDYQSAVGLATVYSQIIPIETFFEEYPENMYLQSVCVAILKYPSEDLLGHIATDSFGKNEQDKKMFLELATCSYAIQCSLVNDNLEHKYRIYKKILKIMLEIISKNEGKIYKTDFKEMFALFVNQFDTLIVKCDLSCSFDEQVKNGDVNLVATCRKFIYIAKNEYDYLNEEYLINETKKLITEYSE